MADKSGSPNPASPVRISPDVKAPTKAVVAAPASTSGGATSSPRTLEVDDTHVRLRDRKEHSSSPATHLKHEVARVALRWSEAHPDRFEDDSDEEPYGFDPRGSGQDDPSSDESGRHEGHYGAPHTPDRGSKGSQLSNGGILLPCGGASASPEGKSIEEEHPVTQTDSERAAFVAKRAFKVRMIVEEILSTERGFCETLDKLGDLEMRLRQQFLSVQESSLLFGNLEALTNLHATLFSNLVALVPDSESWDPSPDDLDVCVKQICRALSSTDFLTVYAPYCANHPAQLSTLAARGTDAPFQAALEAWQTTEGSKLPLTSFLLKPVQRILKYPLLVDQLRRATSAESPAMTSLQQAHRMLETVAQDANRIKRQQELETLMAGDVLIVRGRTLSDKLRTGGFDGNLALFGALLDEEAGLTMVASRRRTSRKPTNRSLYLFRRALLSCKQIDENKISVKRIFATGTFHVKGFKKSLEVLEHNTSIRYTFSGLDGVAWAEKIGALPTLNAPGNGSSPLPGGLDTAVEDSPLAASKPLDSSPKAFFAPLSTPNNLPIQRSKSVSMTGAVERLTQERAGLLKRNEKLLKERWMMMRQQSAAAEERQALVTAHSLVLEDKDTQLALIEGDRDSLRAELEGALEEEGEKVDDLEACVAELEDQLIQATHEAATSNAEAAKVQIQLDEQTKSVFELQGLQRARVVTLEETIVALKGAADAARAEVAEANAHTVELEVDLEKTRTELTAELEIARVDIAAHRASITDGVARLHALLTGPVVNNGEGLHALLAQPAVDNDEASDPPSQALSGVLTSLEAAYAAVLLRATTAEANATASAAGTQDLQARVDAELAAKEQTVSALSMTIATAMAEAESAATARNELVAELQAAREAQEAGAESLAATVAELTASTLLAEGLRRELEDSSRLVEAGVKLEVEHAESVQKLKQTIADLHNDLDEAVQQKEDELGNLAVELAETKANLHQYQGGSSPTPARRSLGSHSLNVTDTDDSIGLQTAGRPVPKSDSNTNDPGLAWLGGWLFDS